MVRFQRWNGSTTHLGSRWDSPAAKPSQFPSHQLRDQHWPAKRDRDSTMTVGESSTPSDSRWVAFLEKVDVIEGPAALELRARWVDVFVDESGDYFQKQIRDWRFPYRGYLWDCLRGGQPVSETEVWHRAAKSGSVYVMWDMHDSSRVAIPGYFRFSIGSVLVSSPGTIEVGHEFLPEVLYIFDKTFEWTTALTHEWVDQSRFCVLSTPGLRSRPGDRP